MESVTVVVVDVNPSFLRVVAQFLEERASTGIVVLATCSQPDAALLIVRDLQPHIIIVGLDSSTPQLLDLVGRLRTDFPVIPVIILAQLDIIEYQQVAWQAGAHGFLGKDTLHRHLIPMIHSVWSIPQPQG